MRPPETERAAHLTRPSPDVKASDVPVATWDDDSHATPRVAPCSLVWSAVRKRPCRRGSARGRSPLQWGDRGSTHSRSDAQGPAAHANHDATPVEPSGLGAVRALGLDRRSERRDPHAAPPGPRFACLAPPFLGGRPRVTWNNAGHFAALGSPTFASSPAPTIVLDRPRGSPTPVTLTLQGLIRDDGSLTSDHWSISNAIVLHVR